MSRKQGRIQRFLHWLFGSPFEHMSGTIGDPVPPELRVFEAQVNEMQHHLDGKIPEATFHSDRTKPG